MGWGIEVDAWRRVGGGRIGWIGMLREGATYVVLLAVIHFFYVDFYVVICLGVKLY